MAPFPKSFCPPALPDVVAAAYPDRTLLTVRAYIANRENATTATSYTSDGYSIQVTFVAAEPPGLSHICVHFPEDPELFMAPRVVATQGNLILLAVCIGSDPVELTIDNFIYSVDDSDGGGQAPPSLDLLPDPGHDISRACVGLVPSSRPGGTYSVVTLSPDDIGAMRFNLCVHHEKTGLWRTKTVYRKPSHADDGNHGLKPIIPFFPTKVIWLQGSTVAWVDIRRGVVLCDVLDDNKDPVADYIPLPEPLNGKNKEALESPGDPAFFRDVIGKQGSIKFVEMEYRYDPDFVPCGWKAVTRSWTVGSSEEGWRTDSVVDFTDVLENSAGMLSSLLCLEDSSSRSGGVLVGFKNVPLFSPTLCERDSVLYLMSKPNHRKAGGSVVAVDTSSNGYARGHDQPGPALERPNARS
ncbi:hypothetical protein PR202_gb17961 [Eleusine coracana subsp. coracana]|uniref:DUF1618 domain-containing protein n=1 Tax=Eleusine coracana subsp. coracana TaxID=191504 RepID=A0AAV5F5Q8_ELECO|nr:hypothetical protein PR202_gb17961 [Eleusine coracana subsp. coracana]